MNMTRELEMNYLEEDLGTTHSSFKVGGFEGPLDLLLTLIKDKKMDILSINLAQVADQYVEILLHNLDISLDIASEYFLIASQLLAIKTKRLVDLQNQEETIIDSDEENLIESLLKYEQVKKDSIEITKLFDEVSIMDKIDDDLESFLKINKNLDNIVIKNTQKDLSKMLEMIIEKTKSLKSQKVPTIRRRKITIEEILNFIQTELTKKGKLSFFNLISNQDRFYIAYLFLGILELTSKKIIYLIEDEKRGDIWIRYHE